MGQIESGNILFTNRHAPCDERIGLKFHFTKCRYPALHLHCLPYE